MVAGHKAVVFIDHCLSTRSGFRKREYFVRVQPGGWIVGVDRAFFDEVYRRLEEGHGDSVRAELVLG